MGKESKIFKTRVLEWLKENGIEPKSVRVYNTRRYGLEVRVYHSPMEYVSERVSFRTESVEDLGDNRHQRHGTRGHHMIRKALYTPINEENMATHEERAFTLQCLKDN